ncbi:MAG: hypothetical protein KDD64_04210 [Bdellovibrionales bacterium]|nr:hypothetical protein [Bdellovibrionales bacterium]
MSGVCNREFASRGAVSSECALSLIAIICIAVLSLQSLSQSMTHKFQTSSAALGGQTDSTTNNGTERCTSEAMALGLCYLDLIPPEEPAPNNQDLFTAHPVGATSSSSPSEKTPALLSGGRNGL